MKVTFAIAGIVLVIGIVILLAAISDRKQLLRERDAIANEWMQVDAGLARRADLVPKLVEIVNPYIGTNQRVIQELMDARAGLQRARTPQEKIQANGYLDTAISRLQVIAEEYRQLQSNPNYLHVADELAACENRIAVERRKYNEAVQHFNTDIELFPKNIAAALFGFHRNDIYFKTAPGSGAAHPPNF